MVNGFCLFQVPCGFPLVNDVTLFAGYSHLCQLHSVLSETKSGSFSQAARLPCCGYCLPELIPNDLIFLASGPVSREIQLAVVQGYLQPETSEARRTLHSAHFALLPGTSVPPLPCVPSRLLALDLALACHFPKYCCAGPGLVAEPCADNRSNMPRCIARPRISPVWSWPTVSGSIGVSGRDLGPPCKGVSLTDLHSLWLNAWPPGLALPAVPRLCFWQPNAFPAWLDEFWRSFLLLQLFAMFRLLLMAVPLRRQRPHSNGILRSARAVCKGAPLALVVAIALPVVTAMPSATDGQPAVARASRTLGQHLGSSGSEVPSRGTVPPDNLWSAYCNSADGGSIRSHWSLARPVTGLSAPDLDTNGTLRSTGQRHITVLVLRHQQRPATVPLSAYSRPFLLPFLRDVESVLEERSPGLAVVPVHPQPHTDHPVVALLHTGKDEPTCPVVCFQVHRGHPSVDFWTDCLEQPLLLSTVEAVLGPDWQAGSIVLVGDSPAPLRPSESRDVAPGTLIRVFLPHCGVIRACSLRDRIRDPEQYCSILEQDGPPAFAPLSHTYGLLQTLVVDKFVQYSPLPGRDALEDVLLSHVDSIGRPMRLCWPAVDIRDFAVRGKATSRVVGAFPSFAETRSPVFLDARPIGQSLRLVASLEGVMPLTVFLETTGTFVEDAHWTFLARLSLIQLAKRSP